MADGLLDQIVTSVEHVVEKAVRDLFGGGGSGDSMDAPRWEGMSNGQLAAAVQALSDGPGASAITQAADALSTVAKNLQQIDSTLHTQLQAIGVNWQSDASELAQEMTTASAAYSNQAGQAGGTNSAAVNAQGDAFAAAKNAVPHPSTLQGPTQTSFLATVGTMLTGHETDAAKQVTQTKAARQQAIDSMNNYTTASSSGLSSYHPLPKPPGVTLTPKPVDTSIGQITSVSGYVPPAQGITGTSGSGGGSVGLPGGVGSGGSGGSGTVGLPGGGISGVSGGGSGGGSLGGGGGGEIGSLPGLPGVSGGGVSGGGVSGAGVGGFGGLPGAGALPGGGSTGGVPGAGGLPGSGTVGGLPGGGALPGGGGLPGAGGGLPGTGGGVPGAGTPTVPLSPGPSSGVGGSAGSVASGSAAAQAGAGISGALIEDAAVGTAIVGGTAGAGVAGASARSDELVRTRDLTNVVDEGEEGAGARQQAAQALAELEGEEAEAAGVSARIGATAEPAPSLLEPAVGARRGDDEDEHANRYAVDTDMFGDGRMVVPPVLGSSGAGAAGGAVEGKTPDTEPK
jgi:hypothetical protein